MIKMLPNLLTLLRILLIPIICYSFYIENSSKSALLGSSAFFLAGITDYLDGWLARKFNSMSNFGKVFDPVADKILVCSCLVMFSHVSFISPLVTIIIISREIFISGLREAISGENLRLNVSQLSKLKTATQIIGLFFLFLSPLDESNILLDFGNWIIWASAFLGISSGYLHFRKASKMINFD